MSIKEKNAKVHNVKEIIDLNENEKFSDETKKILSVLE